MEDLAREALDGTRQLNGMAGGDAYFRRYEAVIKLLSHTLDGAALAYERDA